MFRALAARVPHPGSISTDSVLLGLRTFVVVTPGWDAAVEIRTEREVSRATVVDGTLRDPSRGTGHPDAVLTGADLTVLSEGPEAFDRAVAAGTLTVTGEPDVVRRLVASTARGVRAGAGPAPAPPRPRRRAAAPRPPATGG